LKGLGLFALRWKAKGWSPADDESKRACRKERCRRLSSLYRRKMLDLAGKTGQQSRYGYLVMLVVEGSWGRGGWEKVKLLGAGGTFEFRDREPEALAKVRHSASRGSLSTRFDLGQRVQIHVIIAFISQIFMLLIPY
jgi:hypothetical protein